MTQGRSDLLQGTPAILVGMAVSAVSAYAYQVIAGRTLGPEGFSAIGALWTVAFLVSAIVMIPVEQYFIRQVTLGVVGQGGLRLHLRPVGGVFLVGISLGVVFVGVTLDPFFDGDPVFLVITGLLLTSRALMATGRGYMAGSWRFRAYGAVLGAEGLLLVVVAAIAAAISPTPAGLATALVVSPLAVILFRPFDRSEPGRKMPQNSQVSMAGFLGWLLLAAACSQLVLAGGPLVVGMIGGSAAAVSIFFVTFTLFRGPVTLSFGLAARVLPSFTDMARRQDEASLSRWSWRLGIIGLGLMPVLFLLGYGLGPGLVGALYGAEFFPEPVVTGLGAAGVGAAFLILFITQIFVARGNTRALAVGWIVALAAASSGVVFSGGDAVTRTAVGFVVGEFSALTGLSVAGALIGSRTATLSHGEQ